MPDAPKAPRAPDANIKAIGVDEIHAGKGMKNEQFLTIIRDLQSEAVIQSEKEKVFQLFPEH